MAPGWGGTTFDSSRGRINFTCLPRGNTKSPFGTFCVSLRGAAGGNRTPDASLFQGMFPDYSEVRTISSPPSVLTFLLKAGSGAICKIIVGTHSLVSTPSPQLPPSDGSLRGLARDCPAMAGFPRIHPIFLIPYFYGRPQRFRAALCH